MLIIILVLLIISDIVLHTLSGIQSFPIESELPKFEGHILVEVECDGCIEGI